MSLPSTPTALAPTKGRALTSDRALDAASLKRWLQLTRATVPLTLVALTLVAVFHPAWLYLLLGLAAGWCVGLAAVLGGKAIVLCLREIERLRGEMARMSEAVLKQERVLPAPDEDA